MVSEQLVSNDRDFGPGRMHCRACPYSDSLKRDGWARPGSIARTQARSEAPQEVLPPRQNQMMDEIDVKRISRLGKVGLFPIRTVVISLATERQTLNLSRARQRPSKLPPESSAFCMHIGQYNGGVRASRSADAFVQRRHNRCRL